MDNIDTLDLKAFVAKAVGDVFGTMLSMDMNPTNGDALLPREGNRLVGAVSFAGSVMGSVSIQVSQNFARVMTAAMLGMESDEVDGEEEVEDVIGEVSNMIGGDLKSKFCDAGLKCDLSIPSITSGSDFKIEPMNWARSERFAFQHQEHVALIEVSIKSGS